MADREVDFPVSQPQVLVDEKAAETTAEGATLLEQQHSGTELSPSVSGSSLSPQSSPDLSRKPTVEDYYASRPRFDRLGNPIPERRRAPGAMASVFGSGSAPRLPGDLGPNDPRRPRSPAPKNLPGDLGPNDPRKPRSTNSSPVPFSRHRSDSDNTDPKEGERIKKDPHQPDDEERNSSSSSEDEGLEKDVQHETEADTRGRGRIRPEPGRTTSGKSVNLRSDSEDSVREGQISDYDPDFPGGVKPDPTKGESYNSVIGEEQSTRTRSKKRVHPSTAFDAPPKVGAAYREDENHSELRAAQKLSLTMSQIHSTPSAHRVIRQIIRGDYQHFQQEAEEGRKRQRMYLVATDISSEAEYALEWTIGTVLRDGDTLFAVYAVDEEAAGLSGEGGVEIGHGAESVRDTASIVRSLTSQPAIQPPASPGPFARAGPLGVNSSRTDLRSRSRGVLSSADAERRKSLEAITERCVRLLRKTRLQVRVVVEVFHCKSPRHMITEVIDFLSPTLVVIGSRGRSNVRGVLLGSFSNYLVTKSSVPVMVARKKLRKHGKGEKTINRDGTTVPYSGSGRTGVSRLSNVIEAPKGRGLRVQGWDKVGID
ncbi:adenine nucleotide alpha hydrolases-like protein [Polychaeton citri CBS 116435]|uniref:Adenine nucleotide alpha hydrolases-like protein n=1 Tax=Polychaeton citri CBS 116435 TaxID=1314669 RepID=A0A9P4Q6D5_9PEZI|nr:adenine nucleotide alpha hydrolases-like protein [Polychaeton citri CBS 116435]